MSSSKVVYKKLLGQVPTFSDLMDAQPSLARGLKQLLEFEGDVEGVFCRLGSSRGRGVPEGSQMVLGIA